MDGTGAGKTTFIKFWLGKVCYYYNDRNFNDNLEIFVFDHKNGNDFTFLQGKTNYFTGDNVYTGIDVIYNEFLKRRNDVEYRKNCKRLIVFIDEYSTLQSLMSKQVADNLKPKLFASLSESREMKITMVYGMQRCDARFFDSARDNIATRVGLGTLTDEAKKMLYDEFSDFATATNKVGEAYLYRYGSKDENGFPVGLERITTKLLKDDEKKDVEDIIKKFMR